MRLQEGKNQAAITMLKRAAVLAHELGERVQESDVLGNLGQANLAIGQRKRARRFFRRALAAARQARDRFAVKIALEHLATFLLSQDRKSRKPSTQSQTNPNRLGPAGREGGGSTARGTPVTPPDPVSRALRLFGKSLDLATGDRHHEAKLLWQLAVAHAELGQRDQAIDQARESIAVLEGLGRPEAAWFAHHLQKYQAATGAPGSNGSGSAGAEPSLAALRGGSIDTSSASDLTHAGSVQGRRARKTGPGLLRTAASATRAMAKFVKSGLKSVSPTVYAERLQTCAGCEYHSGLRCRICGCFTNMKAKLPHEKCPLGKWPVYVDTRAAGQAADVDRAERTTKAQRTQGRKGTKKT